MEMPGTAKLNTRLITISTPSPDCARLMPRDRWKEAAAPMIPKMAPDAPTVSTSGLASMTAKAPAARQVTYRAR